MSLFRSLLSSSDGSIIPKEYTLLSCLKITQATGSYIDLNRNVTWGDKIIMDLQPTLYSTNWTTLACSTVGQNYYRFYYNSEGIAPSANVGIVMSNVGTGSTGRATGLQEQRRTFTMTHRTNELSIKVSNIPTLNYSITPSQTPINTGYWRLYATNSNNDRYRGKIFSTQVYDINDNLIINLYPCLRKSDNVAGMYDAINKVFYTSLTNVPFEYETL